jgi:hypothetical protein
VAAQELMALELRLWLTPAAAAAVDQLAAQVLTVL